ncbi:methyltransferase domain-containing protein [Agrococcus baldri]|uniref:Trans-aconitate 2-methyltransferase n=1 Tax=Agrococcus baldri TaxID=153730 RepID=A0AA87RA98_9MICO|nr:methyltransferase domain-containing protein [Agrococcus baldri]GEK78982.1 trans-aconitate 2-methyltransferase [Agrococcus baldri]
MASTPTPDPAGPDTATPDPGTPDPGTPDTWDPQRYLAYADERGRPFVELVARIGAERPARVADLGCGPGNLTRLLAERWPAAYVTGVDASAAMIERAEADQQVDHPGIEWQLADAREWQPEAQLDVLVTNATLQWIPDHLALLPRLTGMLAPGGWFAMQVPGNFAEPSHTLRDEVAALPAFAEHTGTAQRPASHDAVDYLRALTALGLEADAWETTYLHVLRGPDAVFEWVRATGARPVLQALPDALRPAFEEEFKARLREAYPADEAGRVVLPFRRVFAVGRA